MQLQPVTDADFQETVRSETGKVLVKFSAAHCVPCKELTPTLESLNAELDDVKMFSMDLTEEGSDNTATEYGVRGLPAMILFDGGMVRDMKVGNMSKLALRQWIADAY